MLWRHIWHCPQMSRRPSLVNPQKKQTQTPAPSLPLTPAHDAQPLPTPHARPRPPPPRGSPLGPQPTPQASALPRPRPFGLPRPRPPHRVHGPPSCLRATPAKSRLRSGIRRRVSESRVGLGENRVAGCECFVFAFSSSRLPRYHEVGRNAYPHLIIPPYPFPHSDLGQHLVRPQLPTKIPSHAPTLTPSKVTSA